MASLNDKDRDLDSQIRTAIPILGQQVLNLNTSITGMLTEGFKNQLQQAAKMEGKLDDFLEGKIAFTMTPVKRQKLLHWTTAEENSETVNPIPIDPRLLAASTSTTSTTQASLSFVSPSKKASSARSKSAAARATTTPPPVYQLSRNVHTITDLLKEWTQGIGTGPLVDSMNEKYGDAWRKGWKGSEREFYSVRKTIIIHIREEAGDGSVEAIAWAMEAERASKKMTLNKLSKRLRKGYE